MVAITAENVERVTEGLKRGEMPGAAKSLAEAVCRVMEQVSYVQKDKQMQGGGSYKYVSVEAVIDALRPAMIHQQLVLLPRDIQPMTLESFENKNGTKQNRTQVKYTFDMIHAPSGDSRPIVVIGEAIDVGDKSGNKAMTAARKYALIMAFNIETGIDPDDTPSHQQERAARQQPQQPQPPSLCEQAIKAVHKCNSDQEMKGLIAKIKSDIDSGGLSHDEGQRIKSEIQAWEKRKRAQG